MNQVVKNLKSVPESWPYVANRALLAWCVFAAMLLAAQPARGELTVENSQASQRPGTEFRGGSRYVDITYDATGTTAPLTVSVLISNDDGATWTVGPTDGALSGDIGAGVLPGSGKHIVWDAGTDRPEVFWKKTKARVTVTELLDAIIVSASPTTATWTLAGPAGFEGNGQTFAGERVFSGAPLGDYSLIADDFAGHITPTSETQTLLATGCLTFNPVWALEGYGFEEITINLPGDVPLVLVKIPAGSFVMGSPESERSREDDEGPTHTVTLSSDFYMGKHEVTQAQWLAVMGDWLGKAPDPQWGAGDNYPVYYVSWNFVAGPGGFVEKLNQYITSSGQGPATFRLPTEAEWEYAYRAGTQTRFHFGDSLDVPDTGVDGPTGRLPGKRSNYMWFGGNNSDYRAKEVGQKFPNLFGLYDMVGNLHEFTQDWHGLYSPDAQTDPTGPLNGSRRVVRGGYWNGGAYYSRSANRHIPHLPDNSGSFQVGFRVQRGL